LHIVQKKKREKVKWKTHLGRLERLEEDKRETEARTGETLIQMKSTYKVFKFNFGAWKLKAFNESVETRASYIHIHTHVSIYISPLPRLDAVDARIVS